VVIRLKYPIIDQLLCYLFSNSAIALANGQQAKTNGLGHVVVCLGTKEFQMHVIVAEVEDDSILGMDFLS